MKKQNYLVLALIALSLGVSGCQSMIPGTQSATANLGGLSAGITPAPKGQKNPLSPIDNAPLNLGAGTSYSTPSLDRAAAEKSTASPVLTAPAAAPVAGMPATDQSNNMVMPEPQPTAEPTSAPSAVPTAVPSADPSVLPSASPQAEATDYFYFSYDDSASTAGVELTKYALNHGFAPNASWARPWEFLNYEHFARQGQESTGVFQVSMGLWQHGATAGQEMGNRYDLGVHVSAPTLSASERQNLALTLVVDVSGSMNEQTPVVEEGGAAPSRLEVAKAGLEALVQSLKPGDTINLVTFSTSAVVALENFDYQGDASKFLSVVRSLQTQGGTNLNAGITTAYQLAQKSFVPGKLNRVLMLTDAYANIGEVDPSVLSKQTRINNSEGIYFSGLGLGQDFNEAFMNQLTEAGRGAYFSVITRKDAERAFQERFMALMTVAARDVQFRLDYPAALKHTQSAAEESSQDQSKVQPTNFSYNTSQYFWERFSAEDAATLLDQKMKLTILYTDPQSGEKKQEIYSRTLREILGKDLNNIKDARMITLLTSLMKKEIKADEAKQELAGELGDHASALATEYRKLIEAWFKLNTP